MSSYFMAYETSYKWPDVKNVSDPLHYTDDFSVDKGYFLEDNATRDFKIENGILTAESPEGCAITYLHTYEKNVTFRARMQFSAINPPDSVFGLMLRYNALDAFVRCGIFIKSGLAFIDSREGSDFPCYRRALAPFTPEADRWYDLEFTVDGTGASLRIDGELIASADGLTHNSPGRPAIYANRLTLRVDSVDAAFLSGQGTLWRGAVHHKLPDEKYREGGSVIELRDGTLVYQEHRGACFISKNSGAAWERAKEPWTELCGYFDLFRLSNGDIIKTAVRQIDGVKYIAVRLSDDDGASWRDGGVIAPAIYRLTTNARGGNMNDKFSQISTGRIFYPINYECVPARESLDGRVVFCEFYYSDDGGMTWHKSKTDSWMLPGNENESHFGECKILECDDGSLRMYNSWNRHGCIVYSESLDDGVTWGALRKMPEFISDRASMQFCRDPYADCNTAYYMVWCYSNPVTNGRGVARSRLALAKSTDGKSWSFLGDVWRWENSNACPLPVAHLVDPFIKVTRDYIICGSGISERLIREGEGGGAHNAQRQHIWSVRKDSLTARLGLPTV